MFPCEISKNVADMPRLLWLAPDIRVILEKERQPGFRRETPVLCREEAAAPGKTALDIRCLSGYNMCRYLLKEACYD